MSNQDAGGYSFGYCTWWVYENTQGCPQNMGDAIYWPGHLAALGWHGVPLSQAKPGAIVTFNFQPYGHVAMLAKDLGNNTCEVSEMNASAGWDKVDDGVYGMGNVTGFWMPPHGDPIPPKPVPSPAPAPNGTSGIVWVSFSGSVMRECTDGAHIRNAPGTSGTTVLRTIYPGTMESELQFDGWERSTQEIDLELKTPDNRWLHIDQAHGYGWVASALILGNPPNSTPL